MDIIVATTRSHAQLTELTERRGLDTEDVQDVVHDIVHRVRNEGDDALRAYAMQFNEASLVDLCVTAEEFARAEAQLSVDMKTAIHEAAQNIRCFHKAQMTYGSDVETMPGVRCFAQPRPIARVGLYVPGGSAPLVSTVLMLAIPAKLAMCEMLVIATPPRKDGTIDDAILYAAQECGVDVVVKAGGAQAIASLAFGTGSVPKVDKIFGPGNQYVTAAKMLVSQSLGGAAIDMPAGPSEVLVIADDNARPDFVAADLLAQAEHGKDSCAVLVCLSETFAMRVLEHVHQQLTDLPRAPIAKAALANGFALVVNDLDQAVEFSNDFAPEHLILNCEDAHSLISAVKHAGSVFIGPYSCESAGDYASGPNHSLPTYGYARAFSGVSVRDFQKFITFQELSAEGASNLMKTVTTLAEHEGLQGHRNAMQIRATPPNA